MDNAEAMTVLVQYKDWMRFAAEGYLSPELRGAACLADRRAIEPTMPAPSEVGKAIDAAIANFAMDDAIAFAMRKKHGGAQ